MHWSSRVISPKHADCRLQWVLRQAAPTPRVVQGSKRADLTTVAYEQVDRSHARHSEVFRRISLVGFIDEEGIEGAERTTGKGIAQLAKRADDECLTPRTGRLHLPDTGEAPDRFRQGHVMCWQEGYRPPALAAVEVSN